MSNQGSSMYVNLGSSSGSTEEPQGPPLHEQAQHAIDSLTRWLSDTESRVVILGAQPRLADEQPEAPKPQGK
ncbi:hypothetical protein TPAR_08274 [Tolypocladium paradoxum]|uniref:Uncharacterized protein n=1 Tax=Tolypocladium paradoxum TaxID=94208 RepID=A0A2S4KMV7_9HYPO|nr:hypothetical protein TPAR_08274 [Tolypocladium paradoxum]